MEVGFLKPEKILRAIKITSLLAGDLLVLLDFAAIKNQIGSRNNLVFTVQEII